MEACVLSSWRDCLIAVKWQGGRERERERGGLVRKGTGQDGMGWDGIEGRKEGRN